jgi:hypothetical protein
MPHVTAYVRRRDIDKKEERIDLSEGDDEME